MYGAVISATKEKVIIRRDDNSATIELVWRSAIAITDQDNNRKQLADMPPATFVGVCYDIEDGVNLINKVTIPMITNTPEPRRFRQ